MSRQRVTPKQRSPLQVSQGLCATLALLMTLLGGQHYQRWDQQQDHMQVTRQTAAVGSTTRSEANPRLRQAEGSQIIAPVPRGERWVF